MHSLGKQLGTVFLVCATCTIFFSAVVFQTAIYLKQSCIHHMYSYNLSLILPVLWQIRLKPHKIILSSTKHPQSRTTYPSSSSVRKQQMTLPTTSRSRSYLARTKLSSPFSFLSSANRWLLPSSSSSPEFAVVAGRTRRTAVRQRRGRVRDAR